MLIICAPKIAYQSSGGSWKFPSQHPKCLICCRVCYFWLVMLMVMPKIIQQFHFYAFHCAQKVQLCWKNCEHSGCYPKFGRAFRLFAHTCGSNPGLKIQIEPHKVERGIAVNAIIITTTWFQYAYRIVFWSYLFMGDKLGNGTYVYRHSSCVCSIVSTNFHLDRKRWIFDKFSVD